MTGIARTLAVYERRARRASPSGSGQPTAYDQQKKLPDEHHACHSIITASYAIAIDRVRVSTGSTQVRFNGSYQSLSSTDYRTVTECSDADLAAPLPERVTSSRPR